MGSAASRIGVQRGPSGTAFLGDLRQEAKYGLNLKTHPVQDVVAKSEPLNYIGNTLYPKVGSRLMLVPRQFVSFFRTCSIFSTPPRKYAADINLTSLGLDSNL